MKNTQQITKAMKMVSAAKLRKAQDNIVSCRPYAHKILKLINDIAATNSVEHSLIEAANAPKQRLLFVVLTSDRGLCGGFNNNLARWALKKYDEIASDYQQVDFYFIGKKAAAFFKNRKMEPVAILENLAKDISYDLARQVAEDLLNKYQSGAYDEVQLVYNEFKSAIAQEIVNERLLPLTVSAEEAEDDAVAKDIIFEPTPAEMLDQLLQKHFAVQIYRVMSESIAAEHAARMTAMENATKNAGEMIYKLTLTYNKVRQANITTELIEITSGAEALQG